MSVEIVDEILSTARSVRRKLDFERPIPRDVLFECIDVAAQAPTGIIGENWRFVVVDERATKARVAKIYTEVLLSIFEERDMALKPSHQALIERLHEIPAMIFVCAEGLPTQESYASDVGYYGSILPAAWSLMLALRARDIGSTWTSLLASRQDDIREILHMPKETMHTVMLPVGYTKGAVLRRAERIPAQEITYFNVWNER